jgi:hypothetical protein
MQWGRQFRRGCGFSSCMNASVEREGILTQCFNCQNHMFSGTNLAFILALCIPIKYHFCTLARWSRVLRRTSGIVIEEDHWKSASGSVSNDLIIK